MTTPTSNHCPHCGAGLPAVRDAFCPECRGDLDETPFDPRSSEAYASGAPNPYQLPQFQHLPLGQAPEGIVGAEGLTWEELAAEVEEGGRLVVFQYCVSVLLLTFMRPSGIHLVRAHEWSLAKSLPYNLLSLLFGWWGFPWGFIFTPAAIITNVCGGRDVTATVFPGLQNAKASRRTDL